MSGTTSFLSLYGFDGRTKKEVGRDDELTLLRSVSFLSTRSSFLAAQYELTLGHLDNAELQVEDLKIQLDDALGAEEMLEALTEKNLEMGEVSCVSFLSSPFLRRGLSPIPLPPVSFPSRRNSKRCESP